MTVFPCIHFAKYVGQTCSDESLIILGFGHLGHEVMPVQSKYSSTNVSTGQRCPRTKVEMVFPVNTLYKYRSNKHSQTCVTESLIMLGFYHLGHQSMYKGIFGAILTLVKGDSEYWGNDISVLHSLCYGNIGETCSNETFLSHDFGHLGHQGMSCTKPILVQMLVKIRGESIVLPCV